MSLDFDFLAPLESAYNAYQNLNSSSGEADVPVCPQVIPHEALYLYLLIPAVVFTLILAFGEKRVNLWPRCCGGRPGVVYPMDIMGRSNRFSYAAAFGATASLCADVIFDQKVALKLEGPKYVTVFATLLSMLIYGLDLMPLFAALTSNSILGYFVATLYAWAHMAVSVVQNFYCENLEVKDVLIILAKNLPELLCHLYLSISCPLRFIRSIWRKRKHQDLAVDFKDEEDIFESIRKSYQGIHVRKLLKRPKPAVVPPIECKDKVTSLIKTVYHKIAYQRLPNFRYSTRMLSVAVVSFILIYQVYVELLVLVIGLARFAHDFADSGYQVLADTEFYIIELLVYIVDVLYACLLTALTVGFIIGVIMILHTLASYRTLLLGLYKGKNGHLTTKSEKSNSTLLVGSLRYAGYQVAYIAWGYFIQFLLLFFVAFVLAVFIVLVQFGLYDWLLTVLNNLWPVLVISLGINIAQKLMSIFAFLQDRGKVLALNNRRIFFVVAYFMFFYNIFLGLVSCLFRIIKAVILGTLFLPRLDHSTLPRKFQTMDPGFDAFCGFMHVENAHTHPVVLTFISLIQAEILLKKNAKDESIEAIANAFAALLSMLVYGLDYMPLFTALTANSDLGYFIGTLYAWTFTGITFVKNFYCDALSVSDVFIIIVRSLPELSCHLYLSISLPVRLIKTLWRRRQSYKLAVDFSGKEDTFESIKRSYQGVHVFNLFKHRPIPEQLSKDSSITPHEKIKRAFFFVYHKVVYQNLEGFRYSTRMLSVSVVSLILIYQVYVEVLVFIIGFYKIMVYTIDADGTSEEEKILFDPIIYVLNAIYASSVTSLTTAFIIGVVMILHTLASYRTLLLGLYKGDNGHLTTKNESSNGSLLVGSLRYGGYQVAYVGWGYVIQFLILFIMALILAAIIILVKIGFYDWLVTILQNLWPVLLVTLSVNIAQKVMAVSVFLQQRGKVLALDNRRLFFIVAFFMFFYNIFLGIFSCLSRIIKAMVLGTLFLPRLDLSTLSRKFQWLDPGFDAFCGFMHVENAHTHPVVLTFISLVHAEILEKKRLKNSVDNIGFEKGTCELVDSEKRNLEARFRWKLAYTLHKNPKLAMERKDTLLKIMKQKELEKNEANIIVDEDTSQV